MESVIAVNDDQAPIQRVLRSPEHLQSPEQEHSTQLEDSIIRVLSSPTKSIVELISPMYLQSTSKEGGYKSIYIYIQ